ncbi:amidohydrolase family protein [uncultured Cyclobacterium sp.]|uniref:amidohydrolase family protein n=1 Tax=uncultured Cyclobacterium sp. TaxID=453820 RepID=UPI0030EE3C37
MTRREFSLSGTVSIFGLMMGVPSVDFRTRASGENDFDLMKEVNKYRKIDAYATSNMTPDQLKAQIDFADRLSIEKLFVGMPILPIKATPEEFRRINDTVIKGVKAYPDRLVGEFTINPIYKKEAIDEINRCVDNGLVGTRLYNQVKISDPLYEPIIEKLSALKMIVFMHGECQLGVGGYRMKYDAEKLPSTSTPEDFVVAAKKFPDANFQFAHIGGGGDWECMCKTFENTPNIYVDTGGSNNEENMIDFALKYLGEDRLFFGTDNSYYQSIGKVLASNLNERQKRKLFFDNYNALLKKGGFGVN